MAKRLPDNWRLVTEMHGGTGYGDEMFSPTLYRWGEFTIGRLWWKKHRWGWLFKGHFRSHDEAIEYAIQTERHIRRPHTY